MGVGGLIVVWVVVNVVVAWGATHPVQQADLVASRSVERRTPADLRLTFEDVTYAPKRNAWWILAERSAATIVLIHGYNVVADPRSADPAPMLELAAAFRDWGYNSLIINLGYSTGAHLYSGGPLEAQDIAAAVEWAVERTGDQPVALWGFSDGGHNALLAAANRVPVAAVVTDSAFVDANQIIQDQAGKFFHLPAAAFPLAPTFAGWFAHARPADLSTALPIGVLELPVLLIQGTGDRSVSPSNLQRLAGLTHGRAESFPGADHVRSYWTDPDRYLRLARHFLDEQLRPPADNH